MGTGYTRQSSANIVTGNTIEAADLNAEFNLLESAMNASTGHSHDGTTGEGPQINLTSSVTGTLPIGNGGTGATTKQGAIDALFAGGIHVDDDIFYIADPADNTKRFRFDVGAVTTATDRVLTLPDSNITISTFAGTLLDDANASAARTTLGVAIGSDVQAYDATLAALASYNTNGLLTQTAADTFTGRTITGTADKITVTNGDGVSGNPTLTIASTYVGQSSITTLGTIGTGVWQGTEVAVAYGGTGATTASGARTNLGLAIGSDVQAYDASLADLAGITFSQGDVLYHNGTNLVRLAAGTNGQYLQTQGAGANPQWSTVATPSTEFEDDTFRIIDNLDNTKELAFQVSGITTSTTRTWTVPDSDITFGAYAPTILNTANEAGFKQAVNLEIGVDVQAYDSELNAIAGLTSAANKIPRFTGSGTADLIDFLDEDTMSSNSATAVPSQQSVKAYVDANAGGGDTYNQPTSSTLPVGAYTYLSYTSATTLSNGSTTSGSNLVSVEFDKDKTGTWVNAATQTGTWRNISGAPLSSNDMGILVRES